MMSAFFLSSTNVLAQGNPLRLIEGADDLIMDGKTGNYIVRGNVRLVKDDTKMYCDSAFYNFKKSYVKAYGNVHINKQDTLNLFCDSLFYDLKQDYAKLWGNVRLRDNEYKLVTDSMEFFAKENKGVYKNWGTISSIVGKEELNSKVGYLYSDSKNFFFRGDVKYFSEDYTITTDTLKFNGRTKRADFFGPTTVTSAEDEMYCEKGWYYTEQEKGVFEQNAYIRRKTEFLSADSIFYDGKMEFAEAKGNVFIEDTVNSMAFTGDFAQSDQKARFAFITGHALAKKFDSDNQDTLFIHADTLFTFSDSLNEPELMLAYYGVKLFKSDMQGVCDSLSYDRNKSIFEMFEQPVLWAKNAQLSGDTITVFQKNNDIERAFIRYAALVVTEVDTGKYYNQVGGRTLNAYFDSTEIRRVDIQGNAKTVAFLEEEKDQDSVIIVERSGMNRIYASELSLYFRGGDIKAATYREAPDGKIYPMDQIDENEKKVDGFKWDNERRPRSWQTMILTPEEYEKWLLREHQKTELLTLQPWKFDTIVDEKKMHFGWNYVSNYLAENKDTLSVILEKLIDYEDSTAQIERTNDLVRCVNDWSCKFKTALDSICPQKTIKINDTTDCLTAISTILFDKKTEKCMDSLQLQLLIRELTEIHLDMAQTLKTFYPDIRAKQHQIDSLTRDKQELQITLQHFEQWKDSIQQLENWELDSSLVAEKDFLQDSIAGIRNAMDSLQIPTMNTSEKEAQRVFDLLALEKSITDSTAQNWSALLLHSTLSKTQKKQLIQGFMIDMMNIIRHTLLQEFRRIQPFHEISEQEIVEREDAVKIEEED
jgi:lipopolysaccharide export system protein LptA